MEESLLVGVEILKRGRGAASTRRRRSSVAASFLSFYFLQSLSHLEHHLVLVLLLDELLLRLGVALGV